MSTLFIERLLQPLYRRFSLWGDFATQPTYLYGGTKDLEENFGVIRAEYDEIIKRYDDFAPFQEISPHQTYISNDDKWRLFFLKGAGIWFPKNCEQMPETAKIIKRNKEIVSAYISVLGPRKKLEPHAGPYSGVLRLHLALDIPHKQRCYIDVNNERLHWTEGRCILFDDTYIHSAVNNTDKLRAVLFIDIVKPLPLPLHLVNLAVIKMARLFSYVRIPLANHKKWQRVFYDG